MSSSSQLIWTMTVSLWMHHHTQIWSWQRTQLQLRWDFLRKSQTNSYEFLSSSRNTGIPRKRKGSNAKKVPVGLKFLMHDSEMSIKFAAVWKPRATNDWWSGTIAHIQKGSTLAPQIKHSESASIQSWHWSITEQDGNLHVSHQPLAMHRQLQKWHWWHLHVTWSSRKFWGQANNLPLFLCS